MDTYDKISLRTPSSVIMRSLLLETLESYQVVTKGNTGTILYYAVTFAVAVTKLLGLYCGPMCRVAYYAVAFRLDAVITLLTLPIWIIHLIAPNVVTAVLIDIIISFYTGIMLIVLLVFMIFLI
jgi:hypothetical protein